jgi:LysR family carnitine catabolism transcriptional activator
MNPSLRHLSAFAAVARAGGFTQAARRLHSTQPAVTLLIRQLEENLGARLFDRTTRSVQLTAAGAQFLPGVERLLADLEATIGGVREAVERARGRVVVAALPSIASSILPQAIAEVRRANPEIVVSVRDAVAGRISAMVGSGEVDIGIGQRAGDDADVAFTKLLSDRLVAACPRAHALASRRRVAWVDLVGQPFISMSADSSVRRLVEEAFAAAGRRHEPAYEVLYMTTAVAMVAKDLGIAVLPSTALTAMNLRGIVVRPITAPVVEREIGSLTRRARSLSPAAQFFARTLAAVAAR